MLQRKPGDMHIPLTPTEPMVGSVLRRSNSEQDFVPRSRNRRFLTTGIDDTEEENENDIWVVADPCSPDFGQKYTNMKAIAEKGMACGEYCLVPSEKGGGGKENDTRMRRE